MVDARGAGACPIRTELALTPVQFAWLTAIAILSGSIFRLPIGILADRWGGRVVMTLLLLISAVPCYLMSRRAVLPGPAGLRLPLRSCRQLLLGRHRLERGLVRRASGRASRSGTFGAGNVGASVTKLIGPAACSPPSRRPDTSAACSPAAGASCPSCTPCCWW